MLNRQELRRQGLNRQEFTVSRDGDAKLKLLGGSLYLHEFTARDLSEHARVKLETARAFADDNCDSGYFERVAGAGGQRRGGRPANRYRLLPKGREEILRRLVDVRRALSVAGDGNALEDPEDFSPLAMVKSSIDALTRGGFEHAQEREDLLEDARISLRGAEADFRAMVARQAEARELEVFAARLHEARNALARQVGSADADADSQHGVSDGRSKTAPKGADQSRATPIQTRMSSIADLVPPPKDVETYLQQFLMDWTTPLTTDQVPSVLAGEPAHLLDASLAVPNDDPAGSIFTTSFVVLSSYKASSQQALRALVLERISRLPADADSTTIAKLGMAAAVLDAVEAAEPLLGSLLSLPASKQQGGADSEAKRICALALARLARPRLAAANRSKPAAACHYLLARRQPEAGELAILAPAALAGRYGNNGELLLRFTDALFNENGMKPAFKTSFEEGAIARNMALAMQDSRFLLLMEHMPDLLERDSGRGLLLSMSAPEHGAMELVDADDRKQRFRIKVGAQVAKYLGISEPELFPLPVDRLTADRLSGVLTDRNWSSRRAAPRLDIDATSSFSERLRETRLRQRERAVASPALARER